MQTVTRTGANVNQRRSAGIARLSKTRLIVVTKPYTFVAVCLSAHPRFLELENRETGQVYANFDSQVNELSCRQPIYEDPEPDPVFREPDEIDPDLCQEVTLKNQKRTKGQSVTKGK